MSAKRKPSRRRHARGPKQRRTGRLAATPGPARRKGAIFPVVGVGASAGGLEAIEQFLRSFPQNSGMAFVVVQHLDPTQKGMMAEPVDQPWAMEAVILCGIQGSGKSTFCRERLFHTHVRINMDMLQSRHRETILLTACLNAKQPFAAKRRTP